MKTRVFALSSLALLLPGIALAATPRTFGDLANTIVQLFGSATTDLIVLAIVIYFWGAASSLFKAGEKGQERLKELLLWGVIVIFFAVSIWGIVQLLQSSVFGANNQGFSGGKSAATCNSLNCQFGTQ